jgi:hypothetical protein
MSPAARRFWLGGRVGAISSGLPTFAVRFDREVPTIASGIYPRIRVSRDVVEAIRVRPAFLAKQMVIGTRDHSLDRIRLMP